MWIVAIIIVGFVSAFVGSVVGATVAVQRVIPIIDKHFHTQQAVLTSAFQKQEAELKQKVAIEDARLKLGWDQVLTVTRNAPQA